MGVITELVVKEEKRAKKIFRALLECGCGASEPRFDKEKGGWLVKVFDINHVEETGEGAGQKG